MKAAIFIGILLGLSTLIACSNANSEDSANNELDKGMAAFSEGQYPEALDWYTKAADKGDAQAMNYIGALYHLGQGVEQSYTDALDWYLKAAEKGHAQAMYNIGLLYAAGHGVEHNADMAIEWYQKAADAGHEDAKRRLEN